MSKERLEEFKKQIEYLDDSADMEDHGRFVDSALKMYEDGEFHWIFRYAKEQAEQFQVMKQTNESLHELIEKTARTAWDVEQRNKNYREALQAISDLEHIEKCLDEEVVQVAREALEGDSNEREVERGKNIHN